MNFSDILKTPGKELSFEIIAGLTTITNDDIQKVHLYWDCGLTGTFMQSAEIEIKSQIANNSRLTLTITAKYGTYTATKTYYDLRVKDSTYNADTKTYTHNCYDAMLLAMRNYETPSVSYPITLQNFTNAVVKKAMAVNTLTQTPTLPNGTLTLSSDPYDGLGMSFRDVLDDIANANGVLIRVNKDYDNVSAYYSFITPGTTAITIDDDLLMNQNIQINDHYGPINTITASRMGIDNAYYPTTLPNPVRDYVIQDNILMGDDNRTTYLPAIYTQLKDIEYDTFDIEISGYGSFSPLDLITITTNGHTYTSYVFNDDIVYEQGVDEMLSAKIPSQANVQYQYATAEQQQDRETKFIVDKLTGELSLEGKTINMTADNIKIDSTNFKVDKNGNVIANSLTSNNATITGGGISIPNGSVSANINTGGINIIDSNYFTPLINLSTQGIPGTSLTEGVLYLSDGSNQGVVLYGEGIISCNNLVANNIKCGQSYTNGGNDTWVSFGHTFSSAPYVVCTPVMQSASVGNYSLNVWGITTTGFYVYHSGNNGAYVTFNWIAMN